MTSLTFLLQKTFELENIILELGISIVESCIAQQNLGNKQIKFGYLMLNRIKTDEEEVGEHLDLTFRVQSPFHSLHKL